MSDWIRAVRAPSLTAGVTPCVATLLLGLLQGWEVNGLLAALSVLAVMAVQIAVNLLNDVEDHARHIDVAGTLGGSGVIADGTVSPERMKRGALVAVVIALAAGAPALVAHPALAWVVLGTVFGGLGYSHGPGLKYRALGDLAVLALCGPVLTGGYAVAAFGRFDGLVLALGAAFGMAAIGILHVNNTQDIANDRKAGARTVAMALGERRSMVYLGALYALSLVGWPVIALTAGLPLVAALLPLLSLPPALKLVRKLVLALGTREGLGAPTLNLVRIEAAQVHLAFGAMVSVGLGVALALA